jgi:hypothetical protein
MKKIAFSISVIFLVAMFSSTISAEDQGAGIGWRDIYQDMLEKGKGIGEPETEDGGLAYTPPEEVVLEEAVSFALSDEKGDRACECMRMAVELEYNPYLVIKTIYSVGGDLEIDQLCLCSTEAGVMRAIIAQAATDATTSRNEPIYDEDEIARSECLRGLAFTLAEDDQKKKEDPDPDPVSVHSP